MTANVATVLLAAPTRSIRARALRLTTILPTRHPSFAAGFATRTVARRCAGRRVGAPVLLLDTFAVLLGIVRYFGLGRSSYQCFGGTTSVEHDAITPFRDQVFETNLMTIRRPIC